jgi:hypothetical protein
MPHSLLWGAPPPFDFNNHARAKSIRNGFLLMDMLLIDHKQKEIKLQDQFTLGEF